MTTTSKSPQLPAYALDGRPLEWNADRSAVRFDGTIAEYHSDKNAVSSSALKALMRSPAHMLAALNGSANDESAARRLGTGVHTKVLEVARYAREYVVFDGRRQGTKWDLFQARNVGKTILSLSEEAQVAGCTEATLVAPAVQGEGCIYTVEDLVTHGTVERNTYWVDEATGLTCRIRPDLEIQNVTVDLKTTDDARAESFGRQCQRLGYDLQAAFYTRGRRAFDIEGEHFPFVFVASELTAPHGVQVHVADEDEFVRPGDRKVAAALAMYLRCKTANRWPGYTAPTTTLKLPLWSRYPAALDI